MVRFPFVLLPVVCSVRMLPTALPVGLTLSWGRDPMLGHGCHESASAPFQTEEGAVELAQLLGRNSNISGISRNPSVSLYRLQRRATIYANNEPTAANSLGARLRMVRIEIFGDDGSVALSDQLGVAPKTWQNYEEIGEAMPAQTLLHFIELTGVDPLWLMRGEGRKYRQGWRSREPGANLSAVSQAVESSLRSAP
ncbi:hypothetical protein Sinac_3886 [Singulisphaera acidiphila DSM 18658]|uniref:Uncharacterized protein n=2 Tax=Singulisphaera acidiphila TaxID=466153 RepID=L0DFF2_SINAD|nr:hypothetical protein Sinac_3886 [Singulisphaera acidiphila DSM 18658]